MQVSDMVSIPISSNNNVLSILRIAKPFTWSSRRVEVLVFMLKNCQRACFLFFLFSLPRWIFSGRHDSDFLCKLKKKTISNTSSCVDMLIYLYTSLRTLVNILPEYLIAPNSCPNCWSSWFACRLLKNDS
jgi:hypothetical protein